MNSKQWAYVLLNIGALITTNGALITDWHQILQPVYVVAFIGGIVTIFGAALSTPNPIKTSKKTIK